MPYNCRFVGVDFVGTILVVGRNKDEFCDVPAFFKMAGSMAEYIEKQAAVKIVEKYSLANGSVLGRHSGLADCIASEIAALPAADIAPVVWRENARKQ